MFAVSRDGVVDNNLVVQLAVTKDGVIGGTVLNQATGATFDVAGLRRQANAAGRVDVRR